MFILVFESFNVTFISFQLRVQFGLLDLTCADQVELILEGGRSTGN